MNANCYHHSGKLPLTAMFMTVLIGVPAAAIMGVAYAYATVYVPIIYANILLTGCFGFAIAWVITQAAKLGHVRSSIFPASAACVAAIVGLYFAWAADLLARCGLPADGNVMAALNPEVLRNYVEFFYDNGLWTIGHGGNNAGATPVSGIVLGLVWLIEAGMVVGLASWFSWNIMSGLIYCEQCEKWVKVKKDVRRLRVGLLPADLVRIGDGDLTPLTTIPRADKTEPNFVRLDVGSCQGCSDSNFLTINRVTTVVDKKGKKSQKVAVLLRALPINAEEIAKVREAGVDLPPPSFQMPPQAETADPVSVDNPAADNSAGAVTDPANAPAGGAPVKYPWE